MRAGGATGQLRRASNRAWREMTVRVPPVSWAVTQRQSRRVRAYRDRLVPLPPHQRHLLDEVASSGVAVTTLDSLEFSDIASLQEPLERLAGRLAQRPPAQPSPLCASRAELLEEISVWQWGLRDELLDLVEGYLQLPARYYGPEVRRELADGRQNETRQWHLDVEDHRVFRLLVWVCDVGPRGGAFEWIPRELTRATARELRYVSGYRTEGQMARVVPRARWKSAAGPRWTSVFADTHSVFHRAGTPLDHDRYSVMFTWTSRWPVKSTPTPPFTAHEAARIRRGLSERQLACLEPALLAV
jgi:hypothetical protein